MIQVVPEPSFWMPYTVPIVMTALLLKSLGAAVDTAPDVRDHDVINQLLIMNLVIRVPEITMALGTQADDKLWSIIIIARPEQVMGVSRIAQLVKHDEMPLAFPLVPLKRFNLSFGALIGHSHSLP